MINSARHKEKKNLVLIFVYIHSHKARSVSTSWWVCYDVQTTPSGVPKRASERNPKTTVRSQPDNKGREASDTCGGASPVRLCQGCVP